MSDSENPLLRMVADNRIPHALILYGPKEGQKQQAAYQFALQLLKSDKKIDQHPDIHLYFPEGKAELHPIESARKLAHEAALVPFMGEWKVFIIHEAEKMLPTSSNALLKILEEPAAQTLIILLSEHLERLLPTIVSRCQKLYFPHQKTLTISPNLCALLIHGWDGKKLTQFDEEDPNLLFETIHCWYRDRYLIELDGDVKALHFPQYVKELKMTPLIPLEWIEARLKLAKLAYERSTKLSLCLEMLFN